MANATHRRNQRESSSARVKKKKNRLNRPIARGDGEEHAARDALADLGGDLGLGQLDLGAHEVAQTAW